MADERTRLPGIPVQGTDNVCFLGGARPEDEVSEFEVSPKNRCRHEQKCIDGNKREVTCSKCKAVLDPFDALADVANRHIEVAERHKRLRESTRILRDKLNALRRLEKNTKARLKRIGVEAKTNWSVPNEEPYTVQPTIDGGVFVVVHKEHLEYAEASSLSERIRDVCMQQARVMRSRRES